jgi:hypothetical protein
MGFCLPYHSSGAKLFSRRFDASDLALSIARFDRESKYDVPKAEMAFGSKKMNGISTTRLIVMIETE